MPQPTSMKAIFLDASKTNNLPNFYVETNEAVPVVGSGQILIQVKAVSLSIPNEKILRELFRKSQHMHGSRFSVGQDVSGVVRQIGCDVTTLQKGDEVVGIIPLDYGQSGCSEYVVMHEFDVVKKPDGVSFVDAAGCIGDAVKAYTALHYLGRMCSGDTVLVLEGASAFGSIAIQLAYHWGTKVLTTCASQDEKLYLHSLDPQIAVVMDLQKKNMSLKSMVMVETGDLGADIVIDQGVTQFPQHMQQHASCPALQHQVGGINNILLSKNSQNNQQVLKSQQKREGIPSKHEIISCLGIGGRWITSKTNLQLDPPNSRLLFLKCASLGFLFEQAWMLSSAQQGRYQHILMDVVEKVNSKTIRPNIHHTVPFESATEALKSLDEVRVGKVVMTM